VKTLDEFLDDFPTVAKADAIEVFRLVGSGPAKTSINFETR
jgi:hypothetical protein